MKKQEKTAKEKQARRDDLLSRKGRFYIPLDTIADYPFEVMALLATVLIREARYLWHSDQIEYSGCSLAFELTPPGTRGMQYGLIHDESGLRWEK